MCADVLYACHDHVMAGHCGFTRTWEKVRSQFYFPQMLHYVRNYAEACKACQLQKTSNSSTRGHLQQIAKHGLFEDWSLEHLGPFHESLNGEKYLVVAVENISRFVVANQ